MSQPELLKKVIGVLNAAGIDLKCSPTLQLASSLEGGTKVLAREY